MKLKLSSRIVWFLGAVMLFIIGAATVLLGLQFRHFDLTIGFFAWPRLVILVCGLLEVLFAFYLLALPRRLKQQKQAFIVQKTQGGMLRISMAAIENIISRCVAEHADLKLVSLQTQPQKNTILAELRINFPIDADIPLQAQLLQQQIEKNLKAHAGLDKSDIRISAETDAESKSLAFSASLLDEQVKAEEPVAQDAVDVLTEETVGTDVAGQPEEAAAEVLQGENFQEEVKQNV